MATVNDSRIEVPEPSEAHSAPEPAEAAAGRLYLNKHPIWTYFLTPGAVLLGAVIIAGAIWWTRSDDPEVAAVAEIPLTGAVSTVAPATSVAGTPASLKDTLYGYAKQVGLSDSAFDQCVKKPENVARINTDIQAGGALGVTGTPTFFINNKKLVGAQPLALLEEIIQAELKGSPTTLDGYSPGLRQLAANTPPNFQIVESKPDVTGAAIEGDADAKVIVAEFSDFQCPFCKQWTDSALRQLRTRLGSDVALAFVHFPIVSIHPNAGNASLVAICAQEQGKFWPMHDLLFAKQAEWSTLK